VDCSARRPESACTRRACTLRPLISATYWRSTGLCAGTCVDAVRTRSRCYRTRPFNWSSRTAGAVYTGYLRGRYSHTLDGRGDIFGTAFRPAGFRPLLGRPVTELTDRVVEGSAVFGAAAGELAGRIYDARNVEERIGIAEGFVRGRLTGGVPAAVRTVNGLVDAILADRAILKVDDIVDRYGIGKRNLEKAVSRIHRRDAEMGDPALPAARGSRATRHGGDRSVHACVRARLRRPSPFRAGLQGRGRPPARFLRPIMTAAGSP
jgi:hypothetical protein